MISCCVPAGRLGSGSPPGSREGSGGGDWAEPTAGPVAEPGEDEMAGGPAGWARAEVADWLLTQPPGLLAGFDFSFAPPFVDHGCYLPGLPGARDGPGFWKNRLPGQCLVDDCAGDMVGRACLR